MSKLRIIRSAVAMLLALPTASIICTAQDTDAESARKRMLEEQRLRRQAVAKIDRLRLKNHPAGTGDMLRKLVFADIQVMQIFRADPDGSKGYVDPALGENTIRGILALCQKAKPFKQHPLGESAGRDYVMVVQLRSGKSFEIEYNSILSQPFGGLHSRDLKEALYFVSRKGSQCSVIRFVDGQVTDVKHEWVGTYGHGLAVHMWLDAKGELVLRVEMSEEGKITMDHRLPMHYGDAKVFAHKGKGHVIVLLHKVR